MATLQQLHDTLAQRQRPEDVAEMILHLLADDLSVAERMLLEKAAMGSLARNAYGYTSMLQTFAAAIGAGKQIAKAIEIFKLDTPGAADYNNPDTIAAFIAQVSPIIHKPVGENDFRANRLNKLQRLEAGLDLSKRAYNKKWRLLKRIERKLQRLIREQKKVEFQQIAKHGLAHQLDFAAFAADTSTACFIAYYNARCNMRSIFTNTRQERPFDEISNMLLNRCKGIRSGFFHRLRAIRQPTENTTNWWAIAHIYTSEEVLQHLTDEQKGTLLGKWTTILQEIASLLAEVWQYSRINRETMIVQRGNDSTTWNNTAGAWNKARDNWMNLVYALGLEHLLDELCFGKVLRLMAADVVAWHHGSGSALDPNTAVWNKLPLPWEVFSGQQRCTRQQVIASCEAAGLHPEKSGWVAPRVHGVVPYRPTPELVHGVQVANPFLAAVLKQQHFFSGKKGMSPLA